MGSTIRDLGNTIKEAKSFLQSKKADEMLLDCEEPVDGSSEEESRHSGKAGGCCSEAGSSCCPCR